MDTKIINKRPAFNAWRLSKWNPITNRVSFSEQERFEIDVNCSVLASINSIVEDRIMKLADMIKRSADEEMRAKYKIKRNYYRFQAKRAVKLLYDACSRYDNAINRKLEGNAESNRMDADDCKMRALDMLDFSDDYLRNDFLEIRNIIRKESRKIVDAEDIVMVTHIVEAMAIAGIVKVLFSHFTEITPVMAQVVNFDFFDGKRFWDAMNIACRTIDIRFSKGTKADVFDVLVCDRMHQAIKGIKSKIYSVDFLNRLYEARDGYNPHFETIMNDDALLHGYGKINVTIDDTAAVKETVNKMVI